MAESSKNRLYASYRTVAADVTPELIDGAIPHDSSHCMIADSIKAALPDVKSIAVDLASIRFTDPVKRQRYVFLTPRAVQIALIQFDQGTPPDPFRFVLRGAVQVLRAGSEAKRKGGRVRRGVATTTDSKIPTKLGGSPPPTGPLSNRPNVTLAKRGGLVRSFGIKQLRP